MRPNSELFALSWADVDLTARTESPNGVIHVRQGKTENAQRSVPLTPRAAEALQRRKREAEVKVKKSAFVFPGAGNLGHVISFQHPHGDAIGHAKLEPFEFYCWRHTFGTQTRVPFPVALPVLLISVNCQRLSRLDVQESSLSHELRASPLTRQRRGRQIP